MGRFFEWWARVFRGILDAFRTRNQLGVRIVSLESKCESLRASHAAELEALASKVSLLELERDTLLEIVQRDRERVRAELANYAAARELAAHKTLQGFAG